MNKDSVAFRGTPNERIVSYGVPEDIYNNYSLNINTQIIPVVDVDSLNEYGDNNIGDYYASRSELLKRFYSETEPRDLLSGAEPSILVPYKEYGDAEFVFDRFSLSFDRKVVYAVYVFNTTMS